MGIFDDVVVNAKTAASAVGKKAGELVDLSKLRISAADINGDLNKKFQELGKLYYKVKKGDAKEADLEKLTEEIEALYEQLDAVNAQIKIARHKKVCSNCKKEHPEEAAYCSACGTALEDLPKE